MVKKKLTPVEAGKGQPTVGRYYAVVGKPSRNKNEEKPLKNDEIALSAGNNESNDNESKDNDCIIRTEKGTIMEPDTAPADEGNDLEPGKEKDKKKEEVESSGEEDDGSLELNSEIKNDDEQQELYFNNETEEATIMGADTEVTNVEVASSRYNNVEEPDENIGENSKSNTEQMEEGNLDKVEQIQMRMKMKMNKNSTQKRRGQLLWELTRK